jgi:hypothetical protein
MESNRRSIGRIRLSHTVLRYSETHRDVALRKIVNALRGIVAVPAEDDANGTAKSIDSTPRTGMNADLIAVGATYGAIKATFAGDPPHWSTDGH